MTEGQMITSTKEIMLMFRRLLSRLSPITLRVGDSDASLTSYLLEVDAEKQELVLDEALPKTLNHLLQSGRPVTLETLYDGCRLTSSPVTARAVRSRDGDLNYHLTLPKKLHYLQRRQSYRASVRSLLEITARLPDANYDPVNGRLKDLSVDGCRLEFAGNMSATFSTGDKPLPMTLIFPNGSQLDLHLVLLRVIHDEDRNRTTCGCRFEALDGQQRNRVANLVTDLQRDLINHQKHGGDPAGTPILFIPGDKTLLMDRELDKEQDRASPASHEPVADTTPDNQQASPRRMTPLQLQVQDAPVDIRRTHQSAVIAMKELVGALRLQKLLPIEQMREAAHNLLRAWRLDRQQLILLTRMRTSSNFLFEHSIAVGVLLADFIAFRQAEQIRPESLERLIFAGLCHDLAKSLIPGGIEATGISFTGEQREQLQEHMEDLIGQLSLIPGVPKEALLITRQSQERLDGSGIPRSLTGAELHPLGKLAGVIDAYDTLSHRWWQEDVSFHPLLAMKQLLAKPDNFHNPSLRHLITQQGKYPLGATVRLSDQTLGLVMRQDQQQQPTHLRLVYSLGNSTAFPSRDMALADSHLSIEAAVDPVKPGISSSLLRLPLRV